MGSTHWRLLCPLLLSLACLLISLLPGPVATGLQYHRTPLAEGEWWRLFTAHLTHLGLGHLIMNLSGFWLIWVLFPAIQPPVRCLTLLLVLMLGTAAGLWLFSPQVIWYRGLSGILHGLLIWALLHQLKSQPVASALIMLFVVGKLLWEQWQGPLPGSETLAHGSVIIDAHLYGAVTGIILWGATQLRPAAPGGESE